jgi:hypothetical protein
MCRVKSRSQVTVFCAESSAGSPLWWKVVNLNLMLRCLIGSERVFASESLQVTASFFMDALELLVVVVGSNIRAYV